MALLEGGVLQLPDLQPFSSTSKGPYIDQLRFELVAQNVTLTVRSANPKAKHPTFSFYFNGESYLDVADAKGLNDAARIVLEKFRKGKRNGRTGE